MVLDPSRANCIRPLDGNILADSKTLVGVGSCDLSAGPRIEGLASVLGTIETRQRCDLLAGSVQTARLAGLCSWAGRFETTETG